jgi:predicted  nucleic acid-binding Zn-ribbon protein
VPIASDSITRLSDTTTEITQEVIVSKRELTERVNSAVREQSERLNRLENQFTRLNGDISNNGSRINTEQRQLQMAQVDLHAYMDRLKGEMDEVRNQMSRIRDALRNSNLISGSVSPRSGVSRVVTLSAGVILGIIGTMILSVNKFNK